MLSVTSSGSFKNTEKFLRAMLRLDSIISAAMHAGGQEGVKALSSATPKESGRAASSWGYEVRKSGGVHTLTWTNTDVEDGFPVVIMLQYGHGTGTGGYVAGQDFINPAIKPIFDRIADNVWKAVTSA
jgi:hypothetical protein